MAKQPEAAEQAEATELQLTVPEVSLVLLCGPSGSGKSTFAARHFRATEIVSSDQCRALVGDDATSQSVTTAAFEVLHAIVDKRLELGRLTVVDATNVKAADRRSLLQIARNHDVLVTAIVFDLPLAVCLDHNAQRRDRQTPSHAIKRQHRALRRSGVGRGAERVARRYTFRSADDANQVTVERTPLWSDRRHDHGPFDVIGDVHGCHQELLALLDRLGYDTGADPIVHPAGRRAVFLGDLVDRGPGVAEVLATVMAMVAGGSALCILGNHEAKLTRALAGRRVKISHGLAASLAQLELRSDTERNRIRSFLDGLISHYVLDGGRLVVAHAGLPERYHGRASGRVRSFALYGDTTGETDEYGLPVRYPWANDYRGAAAVVYGHTPVPEPEWVNNTICLDTGCVFGGSLTALRWPEREVVSIPAGRVYYEPTRPLDAGPVPATRQPDVTGGAGPLLDVGDLLGGQHVETRLAGRVRVGPEYASAALEVMSRFAVDPRWLVYLPPTMAPVATSQRPGYLEHPDEAFGYYQRAGVAEVVCQEKHMGSRAVVVVSRDAAAAQARFGITSPAGGVVTTRTGRPFFADPARAAALLERVRAAIGAAGWWEELDTSWLALDAEVVPWSVKASELIRRQYAPTGAAGSAMLAAASGLLTAAAGRGVDVTGLIERNRARVGHLDAYRQAYRRYCWEVDGLDGLQLAPFQLLAAEGEVLATRSHRWHLDMLDRLVEHDPALLRSTGRRYVRLGTAGSHDQEEATAWWEALTTAGGEGMVVKPVEPVVTGDRGLVLAGVKCRGRDYLRIVYGPEYLEPANLERLRSRGLGRKSSLARRELALGLEALERFVTHQHVHRVHECVFAVLALESEPVDPRL